MENTHTQSNMWRIVRKIWVTSPAEVLYEGKGNMEKAEEETIKKKKKKLKKQKLPPLATQAFYPLINTVT